jgi:hypothetical protein
MLCEGVASLGFPNWQARQQVRSYNEESDGRDDICPLK